MALSGTLETFSLPDVLRLLSSTKKTGLLALDGDRGRGRIWVRDGDVVAADADRAAGEQIEGVAFELLRFVDARFEFESGAEPTDADDARPVEDVLVEAESRLGEWREIESVVPSLDVWARMVAELDGDATVSPSQWRVLAQIGTGADGHALAARLGQGEYHVCRELRDLVVAGLVEVDEASPAPEVAAPAPALGVDVDAAWDAEVTSSAFAEPVDAADDDAFEPAPMTFEDAPVDEVDEVAVDADDDLLSELSQLSPRAAAAIEATWDGAAPPAVEEPETPAGEPDATAEGSDEIDQNLLLRFLSSTKQ